MLAFFFFLAGVWMLIFGDDGSLAVMIGAIIAMVNGSTGWGAFGTVLLSLVIYVIIVTVFETLTGIKNE